jgi:hypothetical protein
VALIHQVTTLDQRAIVRVIGELDPVDLDRIDEALRAFLHLEWELELHPESETPKLLAT